MASFAQSSFSGGEWSPYLHDRVDLSKFSVACGTLQNFILMKYGGVRRRPGMQYIAYAKYGDRPCRLFKFQFSTTTTFILELGDSYIRFYANGAPVLSGGSPYEIASPYSDTELRDIHVAQVNDEMRFVHPSHPPYVLRRLSDTNWTFAEIAYTQPPVRDENLDETMTITPSATTGTGITLTATGFTFDEDVAGGYYRIGYAREDAYTNMSIDVSLNNTGSTPIKVKGDWEVYTTGFWKGTLTLQKRIAGGAWQNLRSWSSVNDRNFSADGTVLEDDVELRLFVSGLSAGTNNGARAVLEVVNAEDYGVVKVTSVVAGGVTATADVVVDLADTTPTFKWAEGAWSPARGFPRSITLHQSRMFFGGNEAQAQTIWASDIDGYDRFTEEDIQDSDSFRLTIGSREYNAIQWLSGSSKNLLIGTTGGEYSLSSGDEANILTATSARYEPESELGSEHIQPQKANSVVLFVQRGGRDVSEIVYSFEQDGFVNTNLTDLSEHITAGQIKEIAYQKHRDQILWCITGDGKLIGLTYDRKQEVVGWHRHETQGDFESVAVISSGDEEEEIWFSVKRTLNGGVVRTIERFYPDMWRLHEAASDPTNLFYVDCGVISEGSAQTTVSVAHLENEIVSVLEDGSVAPNTEVTSGSVALVNPADVAIVGLPYESIIEPLSIEVNQQDGTSQGRQKRVHKVWIKLFQSGVFKIAHSTTGAYDTVYARDTDDLMDAPIPLYSSRIAAAVPSRWNQSATVAVKQDKPLPLTILSIVRNTEIRGDA